ncbi:MAG: alpha/beta hydrolase, partial [Desulfovibrionaceae bacterium]|nr:alpha/beta hydrolase [Desulfovibrionaceae bacterium]
DYRGYGRSTGVPSETALKADALLLYDRLTAAGGARKTIVMGRSLGTALAAHVAANREAAAVILVTPFDSIRAVGQQRHPFIPVGLLLKNPFDVLPDAAQIYAPALVLIAARDTTVPPEHARRLAEALRGQEKTVVLDGDHASILKKTEYWPSIRDFLRENGAGPR